MVPFSKDCAILLAVSYLSYLVFYKNLEAGEIAQRAVYILLCLGALTFVIHLLQRSYTRISTLWGTSHGDSSTANHELSSAQIEVLKEKEKTNRQKIQDEYKEQVRDHEENVVKPREQAKLNKKEEDFYKFMGPAWKGPSSKLGHTDGTDVPAKRTNVDPVREASELRQIRDEVTNPPPPPKPKPRKIVLPEEPLEGNEDCVTLIFRTPISKVLKRRFLSTDSIQLVLDYITTRGFSRRVYTVSTSYPRCSLSQHLDKTLEQLGITKDTVLNIEEKD